MSIFGRKEDRTVETERDERARWVRERAETHALLERLAAEHVPALTAEQPVWLEQFSAEYERDVAGYAFDCKRHGDFLSLFISREGNSDDEDIYPRYPRKEATTVNLAVSREIRLIPGHAPDRLGEMHWSYYEEHKDGHAMSIGGTSFGHYAAGKESQWAVVKPEIWVPSGRPLFVLDQPEDRHSGVIMGEGPYHIKTVVPEVARAAKDDEIRFNGPGATVYAPAGLGQMVLDRILSELSTIHSP